MQAQLTELQENLKSVNALKNQINASTPSVDHTNSELQRLGNELNTHKQNVENATVAVQKLNLELSKKNDLVTTFQEIKNCYNLLIQLNKDLKRIKSTPTTAANQEQHDRSFTKTKEEFHLQKNNYQRLLKLFNELNQS